MVCRRGLRSVSLLYWQGCRAIALFKSLCIIRPAFFQVADPASNLVPSLEPNLCLWAASAGAFGPYLPAYTGAAVCLGPACLYLWVETVLACHLFSSPEEHWCPVLFQVADLASNLVPSPEPNLYLWATWAGPYLPVQTVAAAYRGPACLYLRVQAVLACPLFPSLGVLCLYPGSLCRLCPALPRLCPGSLYLELRHLYLGSLYRLCPALRRLCPGSPGRIRPGLCLAGLVCFDLAPGRMGNMGLLVPGTCPVVRIRGLHPFGVRRPFRAPIRVRRRDHDRFLPDRQTPDRPKPSLPAQI